MTELSELYVGSTVVYVIRCAFSDCTIKEIALLLSGM